MKFGKDNTGKKDKSLLALQDAIQNPDEMNLGEISEAMSRGCEGNTTFTKFLNMNKYKVKIDFLIFLEKWEI